MYARIKVMYTLYSAANLLCNECKLLPLPCNMPVIYVYDTMTNLRNTVSYDHTSANRKTQLDKTLFRYMEDLVLLQ